MILSRLLKPIAIVAVMMGGAAAGYVTRDHWLPMLQSTDPHKEDHEGGEPITSANKVIVSEQAQQNLGLTTKPLRPQTFMKTIPVPGMVVDRPGMTDRGVVAPATGVIARVYHFPGDTVRPGDVLFTLKLLSESLFLTQTELFKTTQEIAVVEAQRKRLSDSAGAVPEVRLIEVDNQIARLQIAVKAYRQELLNRGFGPELIEGIARGAFVNEMKIVAPTHAVEPAGKTAATVLAEPASLATATPSMVFEVQELKVELGQQVQAGQTLCLLANHQYLAVEGRAFRDETPFLERSVKEKWPVEVDFQEDAAADWGPLDQTFRIRYLSNTIDPLTRTFAFLIPLENQSRTIVDEGRSQTLWRFRPGQKVRLLVRVEEMKNVFVLPADAVASEGPESFIFTQNENTFERLPVRVLLRDRQQVVIANDGTLVPGSYVVQGAAAQLNRMLKAGAGSGVSKGYHMHADGSLHKNHDD